jgi:hypothetical protein
MATTGIYGICCNNKWYIGSSVNVEMRLSKHKSLLKDNKHYVKGLQEAYNNKQRIKFKILKRCSQKNLNHLEIEYIHKYKAYR